MLYIAICDDENFYREYIKSLLTLYMNKHELEYKIVTFSSGIELCNNGTDLTVYNLVFLDINMEIQDGIETARTIKLVNPTAYIVFVTSFLSYVLEGYKVEAIRYLMKDRLEVSIIECLDTILSKMKMQMEKLSFKFIQGEREIKVEKIEYIESQRNKLIFHLSDLESSAYTIYRKLDDIEEQLRLYDFIRIHKSYLINLKNIKQINNYKVILSNGIEFPVPKPRYQEVKKIFALYKGRI